MLSRRNLIIGGSSVFAAGAATYSMWPKMDGYIEALDQQRRLLASDPSMEELVRYATLAANGHNTQPWKFELKEKGIAIHPDFSRRTAVVDPDDHHLYVSLGCAAENLLIAAEANGRPSAMQVAGSPSTQIEIDLSKGKPQTSTLYTAIPNRQSTRGLFDGKGISDTELNLLKAAAKQEGVSVLFFTERSKISQIRDFVVEGNSSQMSDPAFVSELKHWVRFSPRKAIETGDGLFSACSGNPVLPEWLGKIGFDLAFKAASENEKYQQQMASSAGVAVFVGEKEDPEYWIKVGRSFQRFALQATALGIRSAHINQPIEVPSIRGPFSDWLDIGASRPDLVIRFGHADALPMSIRRPVSEVLVG